MEIRPYGVAVSVCLVGMWCPCSGFGVSATLFFNLQNTTKMKVLILGAVCAIALASCQKSYNCTCKNDKGSYIGNQIGVTGKNESDALSECVNQMSAYGNVHCQLSNKD